MSGSSVPASESAATSSGSGSSAATGPRQVTKVAVLAESELGSEAQRERRKRILDATLAIASKGGYEAVQMRAVAERADVAVGTLYRYFPSKVHLLVSALGREFERIDAKTDRASLTVQLAEVQSAVRAEKVGEVAAEFDRVHNIQRAVEVGSVDAIISAAELRPRIIEAIERGFA